VILDGLLAALFFRVRAHYNHLKSELLLAKTIRSEGWITRIVSNPNQGE